MLDTLDKAREVIIKDINQCGTRIFAFGRHVALAETTANKGKLITEVTWYTPPQVELGGKEAAIVLSESIRHMEKRLKKVRRSIHGDGKELFIKDNGVFVLEYRYDRLHSIENAHASNDWVVTKE